MIDWPPGPPGSGTASFNRLGSSPSRSAVQSPPATPAAERPALKRPGGVIPAAPAPSSDSIAVLTPSGLKTRGRWAFVDTTNALAVLELALRMGVGQIWVGPATAAHLGLPDRFEVPAGTAEPFRYGIPHPWLAPALPSWHASTAPAGLAPWVSLGTPGRWVDLVIPSWDPSSPWQAGTAGELLEGLELYATHVGLRYRRSAGASGLALMREVHKGPGAISLPTSVKLPPPALEPSSQARGSWIEPRLPASGYLHAWDLNGMYLAACSSAELGFGAPAHLTGLEASGPSFGVSAGYYRAKVGGGRAGPAPPFHADEKPRWYTATALEYLLELGGACEVLEAWVYPERRRWLEPWYARLRDARRALTAIEGPGARLALRATKDTYAVALGRLAGSWLEEGDATFRPDWRHVVMDRARANMHRHLVKVYARSRTLPIAGDADTIVYRSKLVDPAQAAAQLGLEVDPQQLGKWKPAGSSSAKAARAAIGSKRGLAALRRLLEVLK